MVTEQINEFCCGCIVVSEDGDYWFERLCPVAGELLLEIENLPRHSELWCQRSTKLNKHAAFFEDNA